LSKSICISMCQRAFSLFVTVVHRAPWGPWGLVTCEL